MNDLIEFSFSSLSLVGSSIFNPGSMFLLLTAFGWKDLSPVITSAEQMDQSFTVTLQHTYDAYNARPNPYSRQQLQKSLNQTIEELRIDLRKVNKLEKEAMERFTQLRMSPSDYLIRWNSWLKQSAQAFFSSDDASLVERYAGIAEQQKKNIAALLQLREALAMQANQHEKSHFSKMLSDISLAYPIEEGLLRGQAPLPQTVTQFCYPSGSCDLSDLKDGLLGFVLQGETANDYSGFSISKAGDVNGDGVDDVLVGAYNASPKGRAHAGKSYVVFGSHNSNAWEKGTLDLSRLMDGQRGFVLEGEAASDNSGVDVSSAGDINGDGVDDVLVGAYGASPEGRIKAGKSYIVFGSNNNNAWKKGTLNLSSVMDGQHGFVLQGEAEGDKSGMSVSSAGDINGDGIDDILIGAYNASPKGRAHAGKSYLVFGSNNSNAWGTGTLDLSRLMDGQRGFVLEGETASDNSGVDVSSAGDVNGDGLGDVLIGAPYADSPGRLHAGKSYVVFGSNKSNAWGTGTLNLSSLMNGQRGFVLQGETGGDGSGIAVSSAGDINGDGVDDILVGVFGATPTKRPKAGKSYVVFGSNKRNAWKRGTLDLSSLMDGQRGFVLQGEAMDDQSGSVSSAGDINGDGLDDMLIGAYFASPTPTQQGRMNAGKSYVVFGSNKSNAWGTGKLDLSSLIADQRAFVLQGEAANDWSGCSVSNVGDMNGDGVDDIVVSAYAASPAGRGDAGKVYVILSPTFLRFTANNLRLTAGETVRLSNSMLALDSTRNSIDMTRVPFTVQMLTHGHFNFTNVTTTANSRLTSFYLQNITDGAIQFTHDGTSFPPTYRVSVRLKTVRFYSDANINFLGYKPALLNNQLMVSRGLSTTVQESDLSATDRDDPINGLSFIITHLQHGQFNYYSDSGQLIAENISQFSQQAILNHQIQFLHDGSESPPSYEVAVSDSQSVTNSKAVTMIFNHGLKLNSLNTLTQAIVPGLLAVATVVMGYRFVKLVSLVKLPRTSPEASIVETYKTLQKEGARTRSLVAQKDTPAKIKETIASSESEYKRLKDSLEEQRQALELRETLKNELSSKNENLVKEKKALKKELSSTKQQLIILSEQVDRDKEKTQAHLDHIITLHQKETERREKRYGKLLAKKIKLEEVVSEKSSNEVSLQIEYASQSKKLIKAEKKLASLTNRNVTTDELHQSALTKIEVIETALLGTENRVQGLEQEKERLLTVQREQEIYIQSLLEENTSLSKENWQLHYTLQHQQPTLVFLNQSMKDCSEEKSGEMVSQPKTNLRMALIESFKPVQSIDRRAMQHSGLATIIPMPKILDFSQLLDDDTVLVGSYVPYLLYQQAGIHLNGFDEVDIDLISRMNPDQWAKKFETLGGKLINLWSHGTMIFYKARYCDKNIDVTFFTENNQGNVYDWLSEDAKQRPDHSLAAFYAMAHNNTLIIYDPLCQGTLSLLTNSIWILGDDFDQRNDKLRRDPVRVLRLLHAAGKFDCAIRDCCQHLLSNFFNTPTKWSERDKQRITRKDFNYRSGQTSAQYIKLLGLFRTTSKPVRYAGSLKKERDVETLMELITYTNYLSPSIDKPLTGTSENEKRSSKKNT